MHANIRETNAGKEIYIYIHSITVPTSVFMKRSSDYKGTHHENRTILNNNKL